MGANVQAATAHHIEGTPDVEEIGTNCIKHAESFICGKGIPSKVQG